MKKLTLTLAIIFLLTLFNGFLVFAASASNSEVDSGFSITSGLDFSKEAKSTFDKAITITGKAEEGSTITIAVYEKLLEKEEKLKEVEKYKIVVGASGYFNQTINLVIGENIIDINFTKDNKSYSNTTSIKRKKSEIKSELEQAIVLPRTRK